MNAKTIETMPTTERLSAAKAALGNAVALLGDLGGQAMAGLLDVALTRLGVVAGEDTTRQEGRDTERVRTYTEQDAMPTLDELKEISLDDWRTWPGGACGMMGQDVDRARGRTPGWVRDAAQGLVGEWFHVLESQLAGQVAPESARVNYLLAVLRRRLPKDGMEAEICMFLDDAIMDLETATTRATAKNTLALARSGMMPSAAWFADIEGVPA